MPTYRGSCHWRTRCQTVGERVNYGQYNENSSSALAKGRAQNAPVDATDVGSAKGWCRKASAPSLPRRQSVRWNFSTR